MLAGQPLGERQVVAGGRLAALGGVVAAAASLRGAAAGFGLANQVTLLRAGLVCLVGGALLASGQARAGASPA